MEDSSWVKNVLGPVHPSQRDRRAELSADNQNNRWKRTGCLDEQRRPSVCHETCNDLQTGLLTCSGLSDLQHLEVKVERDFL